MTRARTHVTRSRHLALASAAILMTVQIHTSSAQTGAPAATGGPAAASANAGPFATQAWGETNRMRNAHYQVERVAFASQGTPVVGNLFSPPGEARRPAVVVIGPVAFVKEQSPVQYASRLAREGFVALAFDPRHHGESGGEPRRLESRQAKVEDLRAAVDYLVSRSDVDPERIAILAVCQGVNWGIEAATLDGRVKHLAIVAGHYLTPETARMYVGDGVQARLDRAKAAAERFKASGEVSYIPIVSPRLDQPAADALLTAPPIQQFYIRWADRGPFWNFHGLWENRITSQSELDIWGHDVRPIAARLTTPTLMVHADRAASGPQIPRGIFEAIPAANKRLVWLGAQNQLQFYEDPMTIDQVVPQVASFFAGHPDRAEARP